MCILCQSVNRCQCQNFYFLLVPIKATKKTHLNIYYCAWLFITCYLVQWEKPLCDFLLSVVRLLFELDGTYTETQTDIMLVTLVPLLVSEPGDQDSIKEAFLERFLKDKKRTVEACLLFIFSTHCCLDLNLSRCVSNRPMKER